MLGFFWCIVAHEIRIYQSFFTRHLIWDECHYLSFHGIFLTRGIIGGGPKLSTSAGFEGLQRLILNKSNAAPSTRQHKSLPCMLAARTSKRPIKSKLDQKTIQRLVVYTALQMKFDPSSMVGMNASSFTRIINNRCEHMLRRYRVD